MVKGRHTYHHTPPNDAVWSIKWYLCIQHVHVDHSTCISHHITQIPCMPVVVPRATMFLGVGVEMRSCANTSATVVSKLVDMEAVFARLQTNDLTSDLCLAITLYKSHTSNSSPTCYLGPAQIHHWISSWISSLRE